MTKPLRATKAELCRAIEAAKPKRQRSGAGRSADSISRPSESPGMIYFVGYRGYVKIGFTTVDLSKRMKALQLSCPEPLTVFHTHEGYLADEHDLHERFDRYRLSGEWFRFSKQIKQYIADDLEWRDIRA